MPSFQDKTLNEEDSDALFLGCVKIEVLHNTKCFKNTHTTSVKDNLSIKTFTKI